MQMVTLEYFGPLPLYLGMGIQIVTALILGGIIGLEREQKMKAAGIKTNIMICLGATLYTAISQLNIANGDIGGAVDPNRMAAQIVSGIGFLGAGAIIQGRGSVIGMTTAATIWVVAAVGMTIGFGYPVIATLFTLTVFFVLRLLSPLYKVLERKKHFRVYHIEVLSPGQVKRSVKNVVLSETDEIHEVSEEVINEEQDERLLHLYVTMHPRRIKEVIAQLNHIIRVEKVKFRETDSVFK